MSIAMGKTGLCRRPFQLRPTTRRRSVMISMRLLMNFVRAPIFRVAAALAAVAVVLGVAGGVAFACVPQARLVWIEPNAFGPPGGSVTVHGLRLDPGSVEVRWNGPDGPLLASAPGPELKESVTIPAAEPGLYQVVILTRVANGVVNGSASTSFLVTGSAGPAGQNPPGGHQRGSEGLGVVAAVVGTAVFVVLGGGLGFLAGRRRSRGAPAAEPPG